jgi:catechol 2,3-dioxygenase-like lactoylglutathione lyase family enzyme
MVGVAATFAIAWRLPMTDATFRLSTIGQILVPVRDLERATVFYRDALGMRFLFAFPGMAFFDADGIRLYLSAPETPDFDGRATIYFRVADLTAAVVALETRGVAFVDRPHVVHRDQSGELWMCGTRDPDGNNVVLMSEVPVAA